jgi:hypothetical protein
MPEAHARDPRARVLILLRDFSPRDRIDALGTICAFGIVSNGGFDAKAEFVFNMFDFNGNRTISEDELVGARFRTRTVEGHFLFSPFFFGNGYVFVKAFRSCHRLPCASS